MQLAALDYMLTNISGCPIHELPVLAPQASFFRPIMFEILDHDSVASWIGKTLVPNREKNRLPKPSLELSPITAPSLG